MTDWVIVIPVKGTDDAKSRFGGAPGEFAALATAIALDTVAAALEVAQAIVVTDASAAADFTALGAQAIEQAPTGLAAAISAGIAAAGIAVAGSAAPSPNVAVLLGDLPALTPAELSAALSAAAEFDRAMVADADGIGTVLITARSGVTHKPAFGGASSAAHRAAGYEIIDLPQSSGLRNDVDTLAALTALTGRLGPRTAAALAQTP